jgi:hypothetical protein
MHPVHNFPRFFPKIHSNVIRPSTSRSNERFLPFMFPNQNTVCVFRLSMRATYPAYLILLDLITLIIIFGEAHKLRSSSLCIFLHPPDTFFFVEPNILLSTPFSHTQNLCSYPSTRGQVPRPHKRTCKIHNYINYYLLGQTAWADYFTLPSTARSTK